MDTQKRFAFNPLTWSHNKHQKKNPKNFFTHPSYQESLSYFFVQAQKMQETDNTGNLYFAVFISNTVQSYLKHPYRTFFQSYTLSGGETSELGTTPALIFLQRFTSNSLMLTRHLGIDQRKGIKSWCGKIERFVKHVILTHYIKQTSRLQKHKG